MSRDLRRHTGAQTSRPAVQRRGPGGSPGKRTLTQRVQRKGAGAPSSADVHDAAARGVGTPTAAMPHADAIQRSFGPQNDVSGISAHVGGGAADACADMGASAFASGDHVAFAEEPSLHTAAHEAAHVVQQAKGVNLEGGVGDAGDAYEAHADAVADRVVAGESVAEMLSAGPDGGAGEAVQRKITRPTVVQREGGAGGGAVAPEGAPVGGAAAVGAAGAVAGAGGANAKVAKLHLFADIEAQEMGWAQIKQGSVGHTWIAIEYIDPATVPLTVPGNHLPLLQAGGLYADPMGFWPDIDNGVYYNPNPLNSYVQGRMKHPDRAHEGMEKARQSWDLTQAEVDAVITYAESKRGAQYSVYFFNCTTFGIQAVAAAGKAAPAAATMGICYPNALYDGIKKNQKKGVGDTMTKDFDGANEVSAQGADAPRKG